MMLSGHTMLCPYLFIYDDRLCRVERVFINIYRKKIYIIYITLLYTYIYILENECHPVTT